MAKYTKEMDFDLDIKDNTNFIEFDPLKESIQFDRRCFNYKSKAMSKDAIMSIKFTTKYDKEDEKLFDEDKAELLHKLHKDTFSAISDDVSEVVFIKHIYAVDFSINNKIIQFTFKNTNFVKNEPNELTNFFILLFDNDYDYNGNGYKLNRVLGITDNIDVDGKYVVTEDGQFNRVLRES